LSIKITRANEFANVQKIKALVYGAAGSGKTVLCNTTNERTLVISAESGLLSLKGAADNVEATIVNSLDDLDDVYDYLIDEEPSYSWIVLDSLSEIGEVVLAEEKTKVKDGRKAYGEMQDIIMNRVRKFRDLEDYHVLFTAKLGRTADQDTGLVRYGADMPGQQLGQGLPYYFDLVMALLVMKDEDGDEIRQLQTGQSKSYICKDRSGELDYYEEANLASILAKITGSNEPTKPRVKRKLKRKLKTGALKNA